MALDDTGGNEHTIEVVFRAQKVLSERLLEVRKRISLINTDVDRPSAQKDWPDLRWACDELRDIAAALE